MCSMTCLSLRFHAITVKFSSKYCKNTSQLVGILQHALQLGLLCLTSFCQSFAQTQVARCLGLRQFGCPAIPATKLRNSVRKWCHQKCQTNFSSWNIVTQLLLKICARSDLNHFRRHIFLMIATFSSLTFTWKRLTITLFNNFVLSLNNTKGTASDNKN